MAELRTLLIDDLKVGMFVKDIILKNSNHKVKNQGTVNSEHTIALLKKQGVDKVVVELQPEQLAILEQNSVVDLINPPENTEADISPAQQIIIEQETSNKALSQANDLYQQAHKEIHALFLQVRKGQMISTDGIDKLALAITNSVIKNEYAMVLLTCIRHHSTYQWEHAVNCAIHMCGFALYLGLTPDVVHQIAIGALMHDIGIAKIPDGIINKPEKLTSHEIPLIKKHAKYGVEICKKSGLTNPMVLDMTLNHHERLDGSGYPRGISNEKLTKLARMIAIVDVYDAITGEKNYRASQQPLEAFRYLITHKNKFDPLLVQQFIKYLGIHPVGSVVQLSNDRLAMVMAGNRAAPLEPIVKIFFNIDTMQYSKIKEVDLSKEPLAITSAIDTKDFEINSQSIIKEFIS
ncbi:HD-GYP domain-containing protein [Thalassotalea piscium]